MRPTADWKKPSPLVFGTALGPRDLALAVCGGVLVFAPLAYGAVHPWAFATLGLALATLSIVLLGMVALSSLLGRDPALALPYPPLWGLVLAAVLLVLLQLVWLPPAVVGWLSPRAIQIRSLGNGHGLGPLMPLSLNSNATIQEILLIWPAVMLFFLLVFMVNSRRQLEALVLLILGVALFEALYGLLHFRSHLIWGWKNPHYLGRLCGTFINANHAAGYLGMAILLSFGLFLARGNPHDLPQATHRGRSRWRVWTRAEHLEPLVRRSFFFLPLLILLVGFFFAASRGAIFGLGIGLALMVLLGLSQHSVRWPFYLLGVFLGGVALYSLWLGGEKVFARIITLDDPARYLAFWGCLRLFRDFPLVGAGLGAFDDLSYSFVPAILSNNRLTYAHNDWVQLLADAGLLGFVIVGGGWLFFYGRLVNLWRRRRDPWARGLGLGGLAALAAGAFHALGEFPLRVPGFSLTYAAVAALTFLILHHHQDKDAFDYAAWRPAGNRLAPWVCGALILLQVVYLGQAWYFWQAERAAPLVIDSTRLPRTLVAADYTRALALNPRNAGLYAGLAGVLASEEIANREQAQKIEDLLHQAIFWAPARWGYHYQLGSFLLEHYELDPRHHLPRGLRELAAAAALFPEKAEVHLRLGLALGWTELLYPAYLPAELQKRAQAHLDKAAALEPSFKKFFHPKAGP